jgi:hypothetical protein
VCLGAEESEEEREQPGGDDHVAREIDARPVAMALVDRSRRATIVAGAAIARFDNHRLMSVKPEAPAKSSAVEADFAQLVATMGCQALRSLACGGPLLAAVGELSRAGLLERSECPTDRRRTMVRLDDERREAIPRGRCRP